MFGVVAGMVDWLLYVFDSGFVSADLAKFVESIGSGEASALDAELPFRSNEEIRFDCESSNASFAPV